MQRNEILLAELFPKRLIPDNNSEWIRSSFTPTAKYSAAVKCNELSRSQISFSQLVKPTAYFKSSKRINSKLKEDSQIFIHSIPVNLVKTQNQSILPVFLARPKKLYSVESPQPIKSQQLPIDILTKSGNLSFKYAISGVEMKKKEKIKSSWTEQTADDIQQSLQGEKYQLQERQFSYLAIVKDWERLNKKEFKLEENPGK
ncbi:hypothetical protein SS50377_20343 [Spironucleus salmonicida]|uniref:Uncharacterized protein n=1 Tax=Spironucleus salmonicida TaxID=348837 RepID=V6LQI9_9EUKA|nr:hypothetical protein SS50377_20343 [Spironucleus salmonicida]|eukprot:EST43024.1 Hypothetical protein SS50377_17327 [Spironucleus salmonicida]